MTYQITFRAAPHHRHHVPAARSVTARQRRRQTNIACGIVHGVKSYEEEVS